MADSKANTGRARRSVVSGLDLDGIDVKPKAKPKPALPPADIVKLSEEGGFPSRGSAAEKEQAATETPAPAPKQPAPAASREKPTTRAGASQGGFTASVDESAIEAALSQRSAKAAPVAKVQFNTRVSQVHYARLTNVKEFTRIPYGTLIEMAIDLLAKKVEDDNR